MTVSDSLTPPTISSVSLQQGLAHHKAGRLTEAERFYRDIRNDEPEYGDALRRLGIIALQRKEPNRAVELLTSAIDHEEASAEAHYHLAEAYLALHDVAAALRHYRRALKLHPASSEARIGIERATRVAAPALHWYRVAMSESAKRLFKTLGPERLDVLEIARTAWRDAFSFRSYESVEFSEYDVSKGPTAKQYDLIILDQVIEHMRYPQRALENVRASLREDGACFVSTEFLMRKHLMPRDLWRWTEDGLRCLLEDSGFSLARIESSSWGNRDCVVANLSRWETYDPEGHSLANEDDTPVMVWALART